MGTYTELVIKTRIRTEDPQVLKILTYMFDKNSLTNSEVPVDLPEHSFFKMPRWNAIGSCNSFYHIPCTLNYFHDNYLFSRSDLKNYDNEIELFIDWLSPYIPYDEGAVIGWVCMEQANPYFIRKGSKITALPDRDWKSDFEVDAEDNCVEIHGRLTIEELENVIQYYKMKGFNFVSHGNENSSLVLLRR